MEYFTFREQYKGTDITKVAQSKLKKDGWYTMVKFDGQYLQIHKHNDLVIMYTSGGRKLCIKEIAEELLTIRSNFIIECEFNGKGSTGRFINDRVHSSLSSHMSQYEKVGISSDKDCSIRIFDILQYNKIDLTSHQFKDRRYMFNNIFTDFSKSSKHCKIVKTTILPKELDLCMEYADDLISGGGEGAFCFHESHTIADKGRSILAIKIKAENIIDVTCTDVQISDTVPGEWGTLICIFYLKGEERWQAFKATSKELRNATKESLIGRKFKVKYEQVNKDGILIQGSIV
jgi:ATP-dependent DNA ligase